MDRVRELKTEMDSELELCKKDIADEEKWKDKLTWGMMDLEYIEKAKNNKPNIERFLILLQGLLELEKTLKERDNTGYVHPRENG